MTIAVFLFLVLPTLCFGIKCYTCDRSGPPGAAANYCGRKAVKVTECTSPKGKDHKFYCYTATSTGKTARGETWKSCLKVEAAQRTFKKLNIIIKEPGCYHYDDKSDVTTAMCFCLEDLCNTESKAKARSSESGGSGASPSFAKSPSLTHAILCLISCVLTILLYNMI